ncbi:MAG: hypothetical protein HKO53_10595, partial [Gemmatimonadetes bacterium]|nr:hypothetical protein [Gemmatimonadota bacterium]
MNGLMAWFKKVARGVAALFSKQAVESELEDELGFHLEMLQKQFEARGLSPGDALRAARREFGGVDQVKETIRGRRSFRWLDDGLRDALLALRGIRKRPGFA